MDTGQEARDLSARVEYRQLEYFRLGDTHRLEVQSNYVQYVPMQALITDAQYHGAVLDHVISNHDEGHSLESVGVMLVRDIETSRATAIQDTDLQSIFLDLIDNTAECYSTHVDTFIHNVYAPSTDVLPQPSREQLRWFHRWMEDAVHIDYVQQVNRVFFILAGDLGHIRVVDALTLQALDTFVTIRTDNVRDQINRYVNALLESQA